VLFDRHRFEAVTADNVAHDGFGRLPVASGKMSGKFVVILIRQPRHMGTAVSASA